MYMSIPLTNADIQESFISRRKKDEQPTVKDIKELNMNVLTTELKHLELELIVKNYEMESIQYGVDLLNMLDKKNNSKWDKVNNLISQLKDSKLLTDVEEVSYKSYLKQNLNDYQYIGHRIGTAESLTSGLIMSTLVDIPFGGYLKYGGFMVYDTDAKRTFIGVNENNVYTERCAIQMATGVLLNSNATIAIAVTGHSMPTPEYKEEIGKVDICIASYDKDNNIIYSTNKLINCSKNKIIKDLCKKWVYVYKKGQFVSSKYTSIISKIIRYITVIEAYKLCLEFIKKHNPCVPSKQFDIRKKLLQNLTLKPAILPKSKYFDLSHFNIIDIDTGVEYQSKTHVEVQNKKEPLYSQVNKKLPIKTQKSLSRYFSKSSNTRRRGVKGI